MRYTFKAYERLKRAQYISTLFHTGKAFSVFPIRFIYLLQPLADTESPVQIGFSIPKKKFRLSVDRHRVRRLLFEAWRLNKHQLYPQVPKGYQLHVFIIFTDATIPGQDEVNKVVIKGIERLVKILPQNNNVAS